MKSYIVQVMRATGVEDHKFPFFDMNDHFTSENEGLTEGEARQKAQECYEKYFGTEGVLWVKMIARQDKTLREGK